METTLDYFGFSCSVVSPRLSSTHDMFLLLDVAQTMGGTLSRQQQFSVTFRCCSIFGLLKRNCSSWQDLFLCLSRRIFLPSAPTKRGGHCSRATCLSQREKFTVWHDVTFGSPLSFATLCSFLSVQSSADAAVIEEVSAQPWKSGVIVARLRQKTANIQHDQIQI